MSNASKFIMWFLIIAGVTTSGLWIAGGKNNEYSTALEIDDAPDMVFSFLTEPKKLKTWVTGLLEVGQFEPNKGNSGDPSSYIKTPRVVMEDGKEVRFEDEVIRFEQDKAISIRSSNSSIVLTSIFQLEPQEDKTQLNYRVTAVNCGIGRLLAPMQKSSIQTQIESDIRKLKSVIEQPDTSGTDASKTN